MKSINENRNAIIYCRVSTKEQVEEGNSLVTQERNCREYAAKHNYNIVEVFIERGESAKTADRTELQRLFSYCYTNKKNIRAVIIYKIDRLSRNTDDYSQIRLLLKSYGIEIKSTSEYFENTPAGRFMENIIANVAQFDNDVRTERSVGGLKQAVMEGRYVWPAPVGYSNVKFNGKTNIALNDKSGLVKQVFEDVAKGIYTVNEIRIQISQLGLAQKDGKPLAKSLFYRLLKNEIYTGWINKMGIRTKGVFEPLINEELYQKVQRQIRSKKIARNYTVENPDFPLRRFITLKTGEKLTGSWSQGRRRKYPYYRFIKSKKEFQKDALELKFMTFLNEYALPEKFYKYLKVRIHQLLSENSKKNRLALDDLARQEKYLQDKKKLLLEKSFSGVISDSILKEQLEILEDDLWKIRHLSESYNESKMSSYKILEYLTEFFTNPGNYWQKQPFQIKKRLQWFEFPKGVSFDNDQFRTTELCIIFKLKSIFLAREYSIVDHPELNYGHPKSANSPALSDAKLMALWPELNISLIELDKIIHTTEEKSTLEDASSKITYQKIGESYK